MLTRKQGWLLSGIVVLMILVGSGLKFWQVWQRSHFDCQGEILIAAEDSSADIAVRYIFDGNKGVAVLRGVVTPLNGRPLTIGHDVWFSFTRDGDDYFLHSQKVSANLKGASVPAGLMMPVFYLQPGEPFYLRIVRMDSNSRLLYTSRLPTLVCQV